jgi:glucan phosphoethanolaminetransferase (alkaline phosphatase superfamily)
MTTFLFIILAIVGVFFTLVGILVSTKTQKETTKTNIIVIKFLCLFAACICFYGLTEQPYKHQEVSLSMKDYTIYRNYVKVEFNETNKTTSYRRIRELKDIEQGVCDFRANVMFYITGDSLIYNIYYIDTSVNE